MAIAIETEARVVSIIYKDIYWNACKASDQAQQKSEVAGVDL